MEIISKSGADLKTTVEALQNTVNNISTDTLPANSRLFGLRSGGVDAAKITNRFVEYSVEDQKLTYSFSKMLQDLPENVSYLSSRVDVVDNQGKRTSIKGAKNDLTVSNVPFDATFSIDVKSVNGILTFEKVVHVESDIEAASTLDVRDFTIAPADLTVQQYQEILAAEIALLKQR